MELENEEKEIITNFLRSNCKIKYWHVTNLLPTEVEYIETHGLEVFSNELIRRKFQKLKNELGEISAHLDLEMQLELDLAIDNYNFEDSCGSIFFRDHREAVQSPMTLQLAKYWGGEVIHKIFENSEKLDVLMEIGEPYVIEVAVAYDFWEEYCQTRCIAKSLLVALSGNSDFSSVSFSERITCSDLKIIKFHDFIDS